MTLPSRRADETFATPLATVVPIDHRPNVEEIEMETSADPRPLTLMELVAAVAEVSDDEQEVLATVDYMLRSGRVRIADATPTARSA